jgi:hypothetical protein
MGGPRPSVVIQYQRLNTLSDFLRIGVDKQLLS